MILVEFLALFLCAIFFGAALYISVAQHPASLQCGVSVAGTFFPPMYNLAAPLQVACALGGSIAGFVQAYLVGQLGWAAGALCLISVVPFTLIVLKPINDRLLDPELQMSDADRLALLERWGPRHWVRSLLSGIGFMIYLWSSLTH